MSGHIRRARPEDHPRITAIRDSVTENVLGDPSRVTVAGYKWFEEGPGVWVWEEDGTIQGSPPPTRATVRSGRCSSHRAMTGEASAANCSRRRASRAESFYRAVGWKVIGTSPRGELVFHGRL
jgi:hypothetical protein